MTASSLTRLVALGGMAGFALSYEARGQSSTAFEVASIRRNLSGEQNTQINISGGRFTAANASLKTLIRDAYDILGFQLAGEPSWLDTDMYNIVATTGGSEKIPPDQLKLLLQNLLADRFRLKVHWETGSHGLRAGARQEWPKFKESSDAQESRINTRRGLGKIQMEGTREPIAILASNLGNQLGRIVCDKTGLKGFYDWMLVWDPDPTADSTNPSIFKLYSNN